MIHLLHISDLHFAVGAQWNNMRVALLNHAREKLKNTPKGEKLLIITGDFHNFVTKNYKDVLIFLPELFHAMDIDPEKDVFVIPGNHDAVDDMSTREAFVALVKDDITRINDLLERIIPSFTSYSEMVKKLRIYSSTGSDIPSSVHVRTWRDKLNILHLNTALIADGKEKDNQLVDIDTATSPNVRQQLNINNLPTIVIGHNDFYDLHQNHQKALTGLFAQEDCVRAYLCGDKHKRNTPREHKQIYLHPTDLSKAIPNIICYKSTADEKDDYSDFGMIWHIWDESNGKVELEFWKWDPEVDQADLHIDNSDNITYSLKNNKDEKCDKNTYDMRPEEYRKYWCDNDFIRDQQKICVKDNWVRTFLRGGKCTWPLALSDRIVRRTVVDEMVRFAKEGGITALLGAGGEGKSTVLMQMCVQLCEYGYFILYHREGTSFVIPEGLPNNTVFIVDNPPDTKSFKEFIAMVQQDGHSFIIGARYNEWNLLKDAYGISRRDIQREYPMPQITSSSEAGEFADCVIQYLGTCRNRDEIVNMFINNSNGFLYAAMLLLVHNKTSLDEIADEIIKNLNHRKPEALELLAYIVLSEHTGITFTHYQYQETCKSLNIVPRIGADALHMEVIKREGNEYKTRHIKISELFYDLLFSERGVLTLDKSDEIRSQMLLYHIFQYEKNSGYRKGAFDILVP